MGLTSDRLAQAQQFATLPDNFVHWLSVNDDLCLTEHTFRLPHTACRDEQHHPIERHRELDHFFTVPHPECRPGVVHVYFLHLYFLFWAHRENSMWIFVSGHPIVCKYEKNAGRHRESSK